VSGRHLSGAVEVTHVAPPALGIRWIISAARERNEKTMTERLSAGCWMRRTQGDAVKKREDTHKMARPTRVLALRW